jgi:hypothetical protein
MSASSRKASTPALTTSVKIPVHTKALAAAAAREAGITVHAWLLEVIEQATEHAAKRRAFVAAAKASLEKYQATGIAYRADDVHAYFDARAAGGKPTRPKAARWPK